jgi:hypothetical protein
MGKTNRLSSVITLTIVCSISPWYDFVSSSHHRAYARALQLRKAQGYTFFPDPRGDIIVRDKLLLSRLSVHFGRICVPVDSPQMAYDLLRQNFVIKRAFSQGGNHVFIPKQPEMNVGNVSTLADFEKAWEVAYLALEHVGDPLFYAEPFNGCLIRRGEVRIFYVNGIRVDKAIHSVPVDTDREGFQFDDWDLDGAQDITALPHS